jgi:GPR endopeptidase
MARIYKEMWESASARNRKGIKERIEKKYFNKLAIRYSKDAKGSDYITLSINGDIFNNKEFQDNIINEMVENLRFYLKKYNLSYSSSIMVVGLGNSKVTADSLGAKVCDRVVVTKHLYDKSIISSKWGCLSSIKPSVSGVTGIDSYDIIKSVIATEKPDMLIVVDTLACSDYSRLATNIQISDDGIEPGRGVGNPKPKLNFQSMKIPVVAIGVPLVIYISKLIMSIDPSSCIVIPKSLLDLVVTAKEIDFQIDDFSFIISESINQSIHFKPKNQDYIQ